ncbi:MAG: hypothetical protein HXX14_09695 [Bacteroidetes bacterium]|nr:hypothetical protein [Bacteroidota bacterium]
MNYFVVKYNGPFGFIKPWTAVRDSETFSQQFLTPSIIEGLRQKLEVKNIDRHKLSYASISMQQEQVLTRGWSDKKTQDIDSSRSNKKSQQTKSRGQSILTRGVMINPELLLAFTTKDDAEKAISQHICLCRNEDILLPSPLIEVLSEDEFNRKKGFELRFGEREGSFLVGFNRFENSTPMNGWIEIDGESAITI